MYEYCHGMVISQYFRHKDKSKECDGLYHEPETEEHIKGKILLYNWLKKLETEKVISNVQLESYIKETKQRPDMYFEQDGVRYVIEFQCTPIATEYLKRRELYRLAGIKDIWVLGLEKYSIDGINKIIEEDGNQLKLDVSEGQIYTNGALIQKSLEYGLIEFREYRSFSLKDLTFKNDIVLCEKKLKPYTKRDNEKYENTIKIQDQQKIQNRINKDIVIKARDLTEKIKDYNKSTKNRMNVRFTKTNKKRYICRIEVFHNSDITKHIYLFFDKDGVECSRREIINKQTGYSNFHYNGYCGYNGNDFTAIEEFIKDKIDELSKGE